jgi:hypothetical protein
MRFWNKPKRRNVVRVAPLYTVVSWVILQIAAVLFDVLELPPDGLKGERDVDRFTTFALLYATIVAGAFRNRRG